MIQYLSMQAFNKKVMFLEYCWKYDLADVYA